MSLLFILVGFPVVAAAQQVKVFTDSATPVTNVGAAQVILLDLPETLNKQLSANLPSNMDEAEQAVLARLSSPEGQVLQQQLLDAHMGAVDAWQLGIKKLPAVVVEEKYVVYGQPDVREAIASINRHRASAGGQGGNTITTPSYQLPTR
jgi:integrating conjugative element protein, PFL_4709 family